jgi:hypothetical protein
MIDPKVAYGQPDPAKPGADVAQPSVSIRWENITAEQALNALLSNYGLQAVEDPKIKITRVTIKDPAAPDPLITKTIQLKFAGPSNVLAAVTASLTDKRSKVVADIRSSQLVIVATEKEITEVEQLVAKLDGQTKQYVMNPALMDQMLVRQEGTITLWDLPDILQEQRKGSPLGYTFPTSGTAVIEDGIALADASLREAFAGAHPDAWTRIEARRAFMADHLGIELHPDVLPFSNLPAFLPPFLLRPDRAMTVAS